MNAVLLDGQTHIVLHTSFSAKGKHYAKYLTVMLDQTSISDLPLSPILSNAVMIGMQ
jgi:hypothetical protein